MAKPITTTSTPLTPPDVERLAVEDPDTLLERFEHDQHPQLRERLPVLLKLVETLVAQYADEIPALADLPAHMARLAEAVIWHMRKEEQLLYPYIRALTDAQRSGATLPRGPFGTVRNPIRMMETEHVAVDRELREVRGAIAQLASRNTSCDACRTVVEEMNAFIALLDAHMTLEHEVVYPKAEEIERKLPI